MCNSPVSFLGADKQSNLVDIPEGAQDCSGVPPNLAATADSHIHPSEPDQAQGQDGKQEKPLREPLLARISRSLQRRRSSGTNGDLEKTMPQPQPEPIAAH